MTFRAAALCSTAGTGDQTSTATITVPASVQAGDVLLVVGQNNTGTPNLSISGGGTGVTWTTRSGPNAAPLSNNGHYSWSATATADSAGSTITLTAAATGRLNGLLLAHYGVTETGMGFSYQANSTSNSGNTTLNFPNVTVPSAGAELVGLYATRPTTSQLNITYTPPAGVTDRGRSQRLDAAGPFFHCIGWSQDAVAASGTRSLGTITSSATVAGGMYAYALPIVAGPSNLNRYRIAGSTPSGLRIGTQTISKVYLGSTQVWP